MKDIRRGLWLIAIGVWMLVGATYVRADDVRGCMVSYFSQSGSYAFEPFLKVADKESMAEDGAPEIWGFRPWNLEPPDKEGKTHPVNIREDQFIEMRTFKQVGPRKVRCPDHIWD